MIVTDLRILVDPKQISIVYKSGKKGKKGEKKRFSVPPRRCYATGPLDQLAWATFTFLAGVLIYMVGPFEQ